MPSEHKTNSTIVINGRHYDAGTGDPVHHEDRSDHGPDEHRTVRHVAAHRPKSSQTLMRQAVKRPSGSLKRQIRVQGHLDSSAERASSRILARAGARQPDTRHLQNPATKRSKGQLISHFSPELFAVDSHRPATIFGTAPVRQAVVHAPALPAAAGKPKTTDELLEYAVHHAAAPHPPAHRRRRKLIGRH